MIAATETTETTETDCYDTRRAGFAERCAKLAGKTTYREPVGGHGTRADYMPEEHAIAAALAFARLGPNDIGPDIAAAIATGNPAKRATIVRELAAALLARSTIADRCAEWVIQVCAEAYLSVIGQPVRGHVEGLDRRQYDTLRALGECVLWQAADTAYMRAARAYRRN